MAWLMEQEIGETLMIPLLFATTHSLQRGQQLSIESLTGKDDVVSAPKGGGAGRDLGWVLSRSIPSIQDRHRSSRCGQFGRSCQKVAQHHTVCIAFHCPDGVCTQAAVMRLWSSSMSDQISNCAAHWQLLQQLYWADECSFHRLQRYERRHVLLVP